MNMGLDVVSEGIAKSVGEYLYNNSLTVENTTINKAIKDIYGDEDYTNSLSEKDLGDFISRIVSLCEDLKLENLLNTSKATMNNFVLYTSENITLIRLGAEDIGDIVLKDDILDVRLYKVLNTKGMIELLLSISKHFKYQDYDVKITIK